ncbi:carbohydrate kinase [Streptomyces sp. NPDC051940]|uniref:carbohydrate kinase family protein n=1 Tax=Streptomyces sp. NPDC051940 TaxID=3155675 RepID=UPI003424E863
MTAVPSPGHRPADPVPALSLPSPAPAESAPVVVLGECVADAFTVSPQAVPSPAPAGGGLDLRVLPGGGPANTAVALARLGTDSRFLGRLSDDVFGRMFRAHLASSGVGLAGAPTASEPSTLAVADLDAEGRAVYSFHARGTADWQWTRDELRAGLPDRLACLHTGSLALMMAPGAELVEELLREVRPRTTVSLDPNVRPLLIDPALYRARLPKWCEVADIVRVSDDDLAHLAPDRTPEQAADDWHALGARLVVVTLGASGVFASLDGTRLRVPSPRTTVVDTVGAGDAFTAGLLHALRSAGELGARLDTLTADVLRAALETGTRVAAATVAVRGANPPWAHELRTVA